MSWGERHDPKRFYHCDCLDESNEHDRSRFYHCDCLEGGYIPNKDKVEQLEARIAELESALKGVLEWAEGRCNDCDGFKGRGGGGDHDPDCAQVPMINAARRALGQPEIK